jgi:paraquat-inducible protein A
VTSRALEAAISAWRHRGERTAAEMDAEDAEWLHAAAEARLRYGAVTARSAGLYSCPSCGLLSRRPEASADGDPAQAADDRTRQIDCPRCGTVLYIRKPASIARTWAYIVAALILYIPANVFPITDTRTLFDDQSDTIFSGVIYLWNAGSWPLALLVFFASITVPLAKLIVLTGLVISVQRGTLRKPRQRTMLYRIVEFIGRWSMLDIFAVSILTALVQLKSLAEVTAGPGVLAFGAVCVMTILASHSFDPRLIWDPIDASGDDPDGEDD